MLESTTFSDTLAKQMAQHEDLVRWVVRRQRLGGLPFDDALHEGRIGLWRALLRYDPSRGTAFSTYAVPAIAHAVWDAVAAQHLTTSPLVDYASESPHPADLVHAQALREALLALVSQLPPRLRLVIVAHHGLDGSLPQTFAAIAPLLALTRQRVQQLHVEALCWLAHPAHSSPLRRLRGCNARLDYQKALARQRRVARAHRSGRRARR